MARAPGTIGVQIFALPAVGVIDATMQHQFPGVSELIEATRARIDDDTDARLTAANMVALILGWQMFGSFIRSAAALDDLPIQRIRHAIESAATGIIDSAARSAGQHTYPSPDHTAT